MRWHLSYIIHLRAAISILHQVKSYLLYAETNILWENQQGISECFQSVGISPLKVHAQPFSGRVNLGKRKLHTVISTIQDKVARALNVTPEEITLDSSFTKDADLFPIKVENLDRLMQLIKEKLSAVKTHIEIIQVLNLAPKFGQSKK